MAGQLRSTVGFLGGGGVTPSPTPTPKARLARFILVPYGAEGEVQVLTDTYGRVLTQYTQDGDYRTACVYVTGDSRIDWDTDSDQELVTLLGKYGYNDALTFEDYNVTINDNGETETLIWDSAAMDFTVDVDMFVNGAQNMYFHTVNDGNSNITVLVDADGKAIMAQALGEYTDVLFSVANNGTEIDTITDDETYSRADIINACGDTVNVTALDAGGSVFLLVMGTHVQYCNADNLTTTPTVKPSTLPMGAAQVFSDQECTRYADGSENDVFVRVNRNFGFGEVKNWGSYQTAGSSLLIMTPTQEDPDQNYDVEVWIDWSADDIEGPIEAGAVIRCHSPYTGVENPQVVFYD